MAFGNFCMLGLSEISMFLYHDGLFFTSLHVLAFCTISYISDRLKTFVLPSEFWVSKFASKGGPKKAEALSDNLLLQNIQDNKTKILARTKNKINIWQIQPDFNTAEV